MTDITSNTYNPDVLTCIANLSNDEVFTPPAVARAMLDMLPQTLFSDPNATFLDPAWQIRRFPEGDCEAAD